MTLAHLARASSANRKKSLGTRRAISSWNSMIPRNARVWYTCDSRSHGVYVYMRIDKALSRPTASHALRSNVIHAHTSRRRRARDAWWMTLQLYSHQLSRLAPSLTVNLSRSCVLFVCRVSIRVSTAPLGETSRLGCVFVRGGLGILEYLPLPTDRSDQVWQRRIIFVAYLDDDN